MGKNPFIKAINIRTEPVIDEIRDEIANVQAESEIEHTDEDESI